MKRFSVVIPSFRSSQTILNTLRSIETSGEASGGEASRGDWVEEILVVDSSDDGTGALVTKHFPTVKVVRSKRRLSPGAARNLGARKARGAYLAFIDADCEISPNWFRTAGQSLERNYAFVGGAVENANPSPLSDADYTLTFSEFFPSRKRRAVSFVPSCQLACRADAFRKVGGFPEGDFEACEDVVFCHLASQKFRILYEPALRCRHTNRTAFDAFLKHHFTYGKFSAKARKAHSLKGSVLARSPILSPLAPVARLGLVGYRSRRMSPLMALGIFSWGAGFISGSVLK